MAGKESSGRPVLVFFECPDKAIDKVGNNNDFTLAIHGHQPVVIRLNRDELGWAARGPLGNERYADFLRMIVDSAAAKQGIGISVEPDWHRGVCLLVLGDSFDPSDDSTKKLMTKLFPKAHRFKADPYGNTERIWTPRSRSAKSTDPNPMLNFPIEELKLGVRTYNCLKRVGIETIGDLVTKTEAELGRIPNFGKRCIDEVNEELGAHGLKLANPS